MIRLVWLVLGFVGGVCISRNAVQMGAPSMAAAILAAVVGCGICWYAAYRGKSQAVATAVATAVASARAEAAAQAQAAAQASVNFYAGALPVPAQYAVPARVMDSELAEHHQYGVSAPAPARAIAEG